ncbi:MAG: hypothetical protein IJ424_00955 [Oscillospiraceae bacterium]|nr:hypothetical protein [Oscillospiraceae bacterium]
MKNKVLIIIITLVYALGCMSVTAFADTAATVPAYTMVSVSGGAVNAGSSSMISVTLLPTTATAASRITGKISSSNPNVTVESYFEQDAYGAMPTFSFMISSPLTAVDGTYELELTTNMYDDAGAYIGSGSYTVPVRVVNNINTGGLTFASYTTDFEIVSPGDEFMLMFTLKNNTGVNLEDVKVSLPGLSEAKFVFDGGFTYKTIDIANGETAAVAFDLIVCDGITSVRETISALAEYSVGDKEYSVTSDVIISCRPKDIEAENSELDLTMIDYTVSSNRIRPDRVFTLTVTLNNSSDKDIEKARLSVLNLDGTKFAVNEGLTYSDFSIAAGETKKISFELIGCDGISSTREVLPVEISYGSVNSVVYCTLSCKPEENAQQDTTEVFAPNIIITEYDFGGEHVVAGTKFPLTITFENTSNEAVIENLKITINGASSSIDGGIAFSAANSANSFFFEKLDLKATDSVTLEMLAKADATPNSYPVDISFSYEYTVNGKRYQASTVRETINIPLQQEDRLVINEPYYPNYVVYVGEPCYVSASLVNMGKSGVYNVTASLRGEGFDMQESSYYIGNIESGREEYYDAEFYPNMAGEINCELVVTYEDANGNQKEKVIPFTVSAQEMYFEEDVMWEEPIYDDGMMAEAPADEGKLPSWIWYAVGGGVGLVVIVVIIIIVSKRKKAKLGVDEDDEDI